LNYEEIYDQVPEMVAILVAILNFSKCSRMTKVQPADSENGPPRLPKTVDEKTIPKISGFNPISAGLVGDEVWGHVMVCR